jgi:hypothetical protein
MKNTNRTSPAHTAGPWHIDRQSPHSPICIKPFPGRIVCDIQGTDEEAEANARLIARAPRLLDVVNALMDRLEEIDPDYYRSDLIAAADDVLAEIDGVRDESRRTT